MRCPRPTLSAGGHPLRLAVRCVLLRGAPAPQALPGGDPVGSLAASATGASSPAASALPPRRASAANKLMSSWADASPDCCAPLLLFSRLAIVGLLAGRRVP